MEKWRKYEARKSSSKEATCAFFAATLLPFTLRCVFLRERQTVRGLRVVCAVQDFADVEHIIG